MSASREKKKRQEQVPGVETTAEAKKGMSKGLKTVLGIVTALVLVAVVVFFAMVNSGYFEKYSTAATVNGHKITPAMANYYYSNAYASMGEMLSYFADTEVPMDEQECSLMADGSTWADYFMDTAMRNAATTYSIYDAAIADGFTLSEESAAAIYSELSTTEMMATLYGYANADAVIAAQYGRGCDQASYEEFLTINYTAQEYANKIAEGFTYTQADIDAYYAANAADFDGYTYRIFEFLAETEGEDATVTEDALAAAEEAAKAMAEAAQGDEQAFIDLALENAAEDAKATYEDPAATLCEDYTAAAMIDAYEGWVTDSARVSGDTTYVLNTNETGYIVVYFVGAVDHNYQLPNVRHILIGVDDTTDTAAMEEAKAKAEALLDEFLAGEATEDAFAALVADNTTDTGSAENGGLYEAIAPGTMVTAFNDWCFDEARQAGDTGIVETEYGYHIMFFSGMSDTTYHNYSVENAMLNADYTAWQEEVTADPSIEIVSMKYIETR